MCAIFGALLYHSHNLDRVRRLLDYIAECSVERGRDGFGYHIASPRDGAQMKSNECFVSGQTIRTNTTTRLVIGNMRAEPTTEYVKEKSSNDQQPYKVGHWHIVHNGTVANDKALRTHKLKTNIDSAAIAELFHARLEGKVFDGEGKKFEAVANAVEEIQGSYAILAYDDRNVNTLYVAANYRPIWWIRAEDGIFFASSREYFPATYIPQMLEPYTVNRFNIAIGTGQLSHQKIKLERKTSRKALVVCSGGLDSVVAATTMVDDGYEVELIHFQYGSRAEGPEVRAVKEVGAFFNIPVTLFPLPVYKPGDSPLLDAGCAIAGGEQGAEYAHEWVPARNLLLLAVATAYAEANGFSTIVLGNNLEEAGAYPDNEPEFINRFNDMLPFAVGDRKSIKVVMPVGNMMKHEIVALGHQINAPMDLTWSCYRAGEQHCGTCGPCYMRRTAFEINHLPEVIQYAR